MDDSVEKSISDAKKINTDNNINYKPEKSIGGFNDKYIDFKSKGDEKLSIEQYLERIKLYLINMKDELKKLGEWKIQ